MIDKLKRKWYLLCATWKYRKQNYDEVCCCGDSFVIKWWVNEDLGVYGRKYKECNSFPTCPSRCAKEYAVTSYVENKMKGEK